MDCDVRAFDIERLLRLLGYGRHGPVFPQEPVTKRVGEGDDELPIGDHGEHMIHQMAGCFRHSSTREDGQKPLCLHENAVIFSSPHASHLRRRTP